MQVENANQDFTAPSDHLNPYHAKVDFIAKENVTTIILDLAMQDTIAQMDLGHQNQEMEKPAIYVLQEVIAQSKLKYRLNALQEHFQTPQVKSLYSCTDLFLVQLFFKFLSLSLIDVKGLGHVT